MFNSTTISSNYERLRLQKKFHVSNKLLNASRLGLYLDKKAIDKKVGESDDIRVENAANEYGLLANYIANIDIRYSKFNRETYNMFDELRKRNFLIQFSKNPEIEDIVDTLTEEVIVKDPNEKFVASPIFNDLALRDTVKKEVIDYINDYLVRAYPRIYKMLNFKKDGAEKKLKEFLIEGRKAWEIIYDNLEKPKTIIGILPIDPLTLTPTWDEQGQLWYIQEPKFGLSAEKRLLHDSQIIYLEWDDEYGRMSYVERLIRPFNIFRVMERSKIFWYVTRSQARTHFKIPTSGKGRIKAAQILASAMERYSDDIEFMDTTGELYMNGQPQVMANREFWMAETDSGTPTIENVDAGGIDLSETQSLGYFENRLYKHSKLPLDRMDPTSSEAWNLDPTSQKRTEIKFNNFINRIRTKFGDVLLKPLLIQLALERPDLIEDDQILDEITLDWVKNNVFEELAQYDIDQKRVEHIKSMQEAFQTEDPDGRVENYFPRSYLIKKYFKLTPDEIKEIDTMRKEEFEELRQKALQNRKDFGEDKEMEDAIM